MARRGYPQPIIRRMSVYFVQTEGTDKAAQNMNTRAIREMVGVDAGPGVDGSRNVLTTNAGAEIMNFTPLQCAPSPAGADLAPDAVVDLDNFRFNAPPNTMAIILMSLPGVQGVMALDVVNGDGSTSAGQWSGYQGFVSCIYNDTISGIRTNGVQTVNTPEEEPLSTIALIPFDTVD